MFTEGLDESALNWVKEGLDVKTPEDPYVSENISPNLARDPFLHEDNSKSWSLHPKKLSFIPLPSPSGVLGSQIPRCYTGDVVLDIDDDDDDDDDDESVCSAPSRDPYSTPYSYSSCGEDGDSLDSDLLQENPLLHSYKNVQPGYFDKGCFRSLRREPKRGYRPQKILNEKYDDEADSRDVERLPDDQYLHSNVSLLGRAQRFRQDLHIQVDHHSPTTKTSNLNELGTPSAPPIAEYPTVIEEENQTNEIPLYNVRVERFSQTAEIKAETISPQGSSKQYHLDINGKAGNSVFEKDNMRHFNQDEDLSTKTEKAVPVNYSQPFHISGNGAWRALIAYDACIRLCLHAWALGCMEAPEFLKDECSLLRNAFGLQRILLQPEEEVLRNETDKVFVEDSSAAKPKRAVGKVKIEVLKVKFMLVTASGCSFFEPVLEKIRSLGNHFLNLKSAVVVGWAAIKSSYASSHSESHTSISHSKPACIQAGQQYMQKLCNLFKLGVNTIQDNMLQIKDEEKFSCLLQLRSRTEDHSVPMHPEMSVWIQPGSGDSHTFFPESQEDEIIMELQDSKGNTCGRVHIKIASITDEMTERVRWLSIYREPEHECVGKVQLSMSFMPASTEAVPTKFSAVGETLAYDMVLEAAMRIQGFQARNLSLHGPWKWLLAKFASYYGVSDSYTKLRYLSHVMDFATPTKDCFEIVYELLSPIISARDDGSLNRQEKLMLSEIEVHLERLLASTFENYKSLDEASPSGLIDNFTSPTGLPASALIPAVQVYTLLHDILSPEAQATLRNYLQDAARKRCKRHMLETEEFMAGNYDGTAADSLAISTAYLKMKTLCMNISNEVRTDIKIHNENILPSSIDLPNITTAVYSTVLSSRLRAFLAACPPSGPSTPVTELLIATADFQRDLMSWNIRLIKGGVDSKELFSNYIIGWIQEKGLMLHNMCKNGKVRTIEIATQTSTSQFVEDMYERIRDTLNEYEVIVNRWPEYSIELENAITVVERAVLKALEKHYSEILTPLKESMTPKKNAIHYMQKIARGKALSFYNVPDDAGLFLNTLKRILDVLHPRVETQLRSWASCLLIPMAGDKKMAFGEQLNSVSVLLRTKYKSFTQAIVDKIADNTHVQKTTKLKRILEDSKEAGGANEIRERMQPLNAQLIETIRHLHDVFASKIFVALCRGLWDKMGQEVLYFLENRKENKSWYKGSYFAIGILDDTFASQMQRLQGNAVNGKELEPPRSIMEARSMLCRDSHTGIESSNYYYP